MAKSLRFGLATFGVSYFAFSLLVSWLLPDSGWLASTWASYLLVYSVAALGAVLVGATVGRVTLAGVIGCALAIQVAAIAIVIASTVAFDLRGSNAVVPLSLLGSALAAVWRPWSGGVVAAVVWPVVWLLVFHQVTPRLAPSLRS